MRWEEAQAVHIQHPKAADYQMARTSLIPGLLKCVQSNIGQHHLPIRIFEVSDVVLVNPTLPAGAKNNRRACVMHACNTSAFELIHGVLDLMMIKLIKGISFGKGSWEWAYWIEPCDDPASSKGGKRILF